MFFYLLQKKSYYDFCKLGQNLVLEKCKNLKNLKFQFLIIFYKISDNLLVWKIQKHNAPFDQDFLFSNYF